MRLRIGQPRRALIVAPHPDDETIGAFGLISLLVRRGTAVLVLVATDGCASHPHSRRWPPRRLARERQRETRRAMRTISVSAARIRFLDLPDGRLPARRDAQARIARAIRQAAADLVVGPVANDDHADHRVVASAMQTARRAGARHLAYPVWPLARRTRYARHLPLGAALTAAKRRAVRSYRTQTGRIPDDPTGFALSAAKIAGFSRPVELFVEVRR